MNFLQHYSDGWNINAIVIIAWIAMLWFVAVPAVACVIAARIFEERNRGEVTGKSVYYGLLTGVSLGLIVAFAFWAFAGVWTAVVAPPVAATVGVVAIRAYFKDNR